MKNPKTVIYLLVGFIVLAIVLTVAALLFYPKEQPKPTVPVATTPATTTPVPDQFDPVEWTRNPQTTPLQTPATTPKVDDQGFTVTLPPESTTEPTKALPTSPGATFPGEGPGPASPATVQSTPVAAPVVKAPGPSQPKPVQPVAKPVVKPVVKKVKTTEFWIQVASFKDRYQAENTAKALEAQGLKGTLTTATVNGQAVVRVRVGPYTNEAEAGKFLAWLKPVKEFEGSYITKVSATRAP